MKFIVPLSKISLISILHALHYSYHVWLLLLWVYIPMLCEYVCMLFLIYLGFIRIYKF